MAKGKLIVLEGIDGSGKSAQYRRLCARMENDGIAYNHIVFPRYDKESSALIRMYLSGQFGENPGDVNAYAASAFYAVDRVASFLQFWKEDYQNGAVILSDRYATSNIIYQMAKVSDDERDSFISWQSDFEYEKLGLPKADAVIYLDVDPDVSQKLMERRYQGDNSKKDLHESNLGFLLSCRESALYAAEKCGWKLLDCCRGGEIKPIDEIAADIYDLVQTVL